ncbi:ABC_transporter substrate-binding protein [Hexamita inflata]|uniref:ABC_transporter substrate-binding protein n=1 Tax=Hexamita inflata TaxID=28002 RepID=A0ABP1GHY6_9EUKA
MDQNSIINIVDSKSFIFSTFQIKNNSLTIKRNSLVSLSFVENLSINKLKLFLCPHLVLDLHSNNIQELHLERCNLKTVQGLRLEELKFINLQYNRIHSVPEFNFCRLVKLDLRNNKIQDLRNLNTCQDLEELFICNNTYYDFQGLPALSTLTKLRVLFMSKNNIKDIKFIQKLVNLESLNLNDNRIETIHYLKKMSKLSKLTLYNNKITDITVFRILPSLKTVNLNMNRIVYITPLKYLTNITNLNFYGNCILNNKVLNNSKSFQFDAGIYSQPTDEEISLSKKLENIDKTHIVLKQAQNQHQKLKTKIVNRIQVVTSKISENQNNTAIMLEKLVLLFQINNLEEHYQ